MKNIKLLKIFVSVFSIIVLGGGIFVYKEYSANKIYKNVYCGEVITRGTADFVVINKKVIEQGGIKKSDKCLAAGSFLDENNVTVSLIYSNEYMEKEWDKYQKVFVTFYGEIQEPNYPTYYKYYIRNPKFINYIY